MTVRRFCWFDICIDRVVVQVQEASCHSSPQLKGHVNLCLQEASCHSSPQLKGHVNFCLQAESCHSSPQPKGHVNFCYHLSVVVNCLKNLFLWNHWANMNQLKFWILSCFTYVLTFSLDFKIRLKTRWEITGSWDPLFSLIKYVSLLLIVVYLSSTMTRLSQTFIIFAFRFSWMEHK